MAIGSLRPVPSGSVLFYLFGGDAAKKPLAVMEDFMADHGNVIMMVLLVIIGAKLVGDGLAGVT